MNTEIQIRKTGIENRFVVSWKSVESPTLIVDFNPFIDGFNLSGKYALIHWQARPKNTRTWGWYDSTDKTYECIEGGENEIFVPTRKIKLLQVDESFISTVPTAVIMIEYDD